MYYGYVMVPEGEVIERILKYRRRFDFNKYMDAHDVQHIMEAMVIFDDEYEEPPRMVERRLWDWRDRRDFERRIREVVVDRMDVEFCLDMIYLMNERINEKERTDG